MNYRVDKKLNDMEAVVSIV